MKICSNIGSLREIHKKNAPFPISIPTSDQSLVYGVHKFLNHVYVRAPNNSVQLIHFIFFFNKHNGNLMDASFPRKNSLKMSNKADRIKTSD